MSGLGGGAVSPGPVVAEVVEPGAGSGEAKRELFEGCRSGDLERVRKLLTAENVNSRDTAGRKSTPLHFAAGETLVMFYKYFTKSVEYFSVHCSVVWFGYLTESRIKRNL